jgi:hypothetical protein
MDAHGINILVRMLPGMDIWKLYNGVKAMDVLGMKRLALGQLGVVI